MTTRIAFGTNDRILSRLIRWVTRSRWSHSWLEYDSIDWSNIWAVHSSSNGVVSVPREIVHERYPKWVVYDLAGIDLDHGRQAIDHYIGADYDYRAVIWNGILLLLSRVFSPECLSRMIYRNTAKLSCSEWVTLVAHESNAVSADGLDAELTHPGRLETALIGLGEGRVVEESGGS